MEREARKAAKLEAKLGLMLGGLQRRHGELSGRVGELWAQVRDAAQELVCFKVSVGGGTACVEAGDSRGKVGMGAQDSKGRRGQPSTTVPPPLAVFPIGQK